jgi:hypothetical protein
MVGSSPIDAEPHPRGTEVMENSETSPAVSGGVVSTSPVRQLAVAAYLARFKGQSRIHIESVGVPAVERPETQHELGGDRTLGASRRRQARTRFMPIVHLAQ